MKALYIHGSLPVRNTINITICDRNYIALVIIIHWYNWWPQSLCFSTPNAAAPSGGGGASTPANNTASDSDVDLSSEPEESDDSSEVDFSD